VTPRFVKTLQHANIIRGEDPIAEVEVIVMADYDNKEVNAMD
jgi:hypothetical protein